jgi:regulatory protein
MGPPAALANTSSGPASGRSLKARALQWLSRREHSREELRRKLLPHALAEEAALVGESADARVEAVLGWLEAHRDLSNERFVEGRVHARAGRHGNLRIRQELKQHQLSLPPDAAQALRDSEFSRAHAVRERKFADWPADPAERAKQARFLAGRGFSPEVIGRLLRRAGNPDQDAETADAEISSGGAA